jgi:uncharacterized membrane protein SpoIIM required for sporulation
MAVALRSLAFRREREATWNELEELLERAGKRGVRSLSAEQLARLPHLYRATLSSLSVARAISLDKNLIAYLESLAGRAYFSVYGTREKLWRQVVDFVRWRFPVEVRRAAGAIALAAIVMLAGAVSAFALVAANRDNFYAFVDPAYAQGRDPAASTSELRQVLYDEGDAESALSTFAAFLFTHNARIGIAAFALGFAAGLPVFVLLFLNGLTLGAFAALYHSRGLALDLWGWLLPHGVTELLAVVLCGGAGLVLAGSVVFPGRHTRLENLGLRGRRAAMIVLGAVGLFLVAGLIEGFFRQLVHDVPIRYAVAGGSAIFWIAYLGFAGRGRERS